MDRKLIGGTLLLVGLLALHLYTFHAIDEALSTASHAEREVEDLRYQLDNLAADLEDAQSTLDRSVASSAIDAVIAGRNTKASRAQQTADQALQESNEARRRADQVALALCRATAYRECP